MHEKWNKKHAFGEKQYTMCQEKQFEKLYIGKPEFHNDAACMAFKEYELKYDQFDKDNYEQIPSPYNGTMNGRKLHSVIIGRPPNSSDIARKYNTTFKEMKMHNKCVERMTEQEKLSFLESIKTPIITPERNYKSL